MGFSSCRRASSVRSELTKEDVDYRTVRSQNFTKLPITVMPLGFFGAFLEAPVLTLLPVITRDVLRRDVGFYTDLVTFSGAGAVIGGSVLRGWARTST